MRAKAVVYTRQRKKKIMKLAKGGYSNKSTRWRIALQQVERSMRYMYVGRKDKKGDFRQLWIVRLNAAARDNGMSYSRFISGLRKANVLIDRKMLAELAIADEAAFKQLCDISKGAGEAA